MDLKPRLSRKGNTWYEAVSSHLGYSFCFRITVLLKCIYEKENLFACTHSQHSIGLVSCSSTWSNIGGVGSIKEMLKTCSAMVGYKSFALTQLFSSERHSYGITRLLCIDSSDTFDLSFIGLLYTAVVFYLSCMRKYLTTCGMPWVMCLLALNLNVIIECVCVFFFSCEMLCLLL